MRSTIKKRGRKKKKNGFDHTFRFRCYSVLTRRAQRVAIARGKGEEPSDIGRDGVIKLIEREEKRLGLPPLDTKKAVPA